jgi:CheY-like chemotaxis protein
MSIKVLTIDDSKTIRMIVKKAFKPYNCEMFEAENGAEGLEMARKKNPELIVLDITMPVMNGIEMLGKLKEDPSLKHIPVIMLTAESGKDNVMQIVKMGVNDYIVKPFKGEQLIERAQRLIKLETGQTEENTGQSSNKYFKEEGEIHYLTLPPKIDRQVAVEIDGFLQGQLKKMASTGVDKFIIDLRRVLEINVSLVKLVVLIIKSFQKANIKYRAVGTSAVKDEFKNFLETSEILVDEVLEDAKIALQ